MTKTSVQSSKKRIVIIHLIGNSYGGVARVAFNLINEQLKEGSFVYAVLFEGDQDISKTIDSRIKIIWIPKKSNPGHNMLYGMNVRSIYKEVKQNTDLDVVVHAHNVATVGLLANLKGIPLVCTIHGACVRGKKTARGTISEILNKMILMKMRHQKKRLVAVSKATSIHYHITNQPIKVIYNGVPILPNLDRNKESIIIGHVGGVSWSKGWDTAYEGFLKYNKKYGNLKYKFMSAGFVQYSEQEMSEFLKEANKPGEVELLGLINNAGQDFIPGLKVLLLPSISEGLPMSILESLAAGVPVIATDVGGIGEVIINEVNGYLVSKDSDEICERLHDCIDDDDKYHEMSSNCRRSFSKKFSSEIMAKEYDIEYINALHNCL